MNIVITIIALVSSLILQTTTDPKITPEARKEALNSATQSLKFAADYMAAHPEAFEAPATQEAQVSTSQVVVPITTTINPTQPSVGAPTTASVPTCELTASTSTVTWNPEVAGTKFILSWASQNATQGTIVMSGNSYTVMSDMQLLSEQIPQFNPAKFYPMSGSKTVATYPSLGESTYTMTVKNEVGTTATCTVSVITQ